MSVLFTLGIFALLAFWGMGVSKRLIRLRRQVMNAWTQVDVHLKRRHDLVPDLVNTVKGAMEFEEGTLEAVISARDRAAAATGIAGAGRKEGELTRALSRFFALAESHPQLAANTSVRALRDELTGTADKIGLARQIYNDIATKYNAATEVFPGNIMAGLFGYRQAELFEVAEPAEHAAQ